MLPARAALALEPAGWGDALVLVERGALELVGRSGPRARFGAGAILALAPRRLAALRNPGAEPVVLVTVTRCDDSSPPLPSYTT